MKIYTGNRLENFVNNKLSELSRIGVTKSRFCIKELQNYINSIDNKICGLYGLRRTGKTTLMLQTIANLDFNNTLYIQCTNTDSYIDLEELLESSSQKYIFIDEITKLDKFICLASSLADSYVDKRIVITGTDSASLLFAKEDELYSRMFFIHTTYISYAEFTYLLNKSLEEYIKYGGTLTDGEKIYNDDENLEEYTNTAIVSNVLKSIEKARDNTNYKRLYDLYISGSLEAAINKTIEINAREFSTRVMTGVYRTSHQLGSAKELFLKNRNDVNSEDRKIVNSWNDYSEICEYIMKHVNLGDSSNIAEDDIERITNFLTRLDVLERMPSGEVFFTQPGMQFCLSEALLQEIVNTKEFQLLYPDSQNLLIEKIRQDSIGHILEHIIRTDIHKCPLFTSMSIGKFDDKNNGEFDLYIINPDTRKAIVYEIKRSFVVSDKQYQHLVNEEICHNFELAHKCTIVEKAVIYQGKTTLLDGINYYNASEFLTNLVSVKEKLLAGNLDISIDEHNISVGEDDIGIG